AHRRQQLGAGPELPGRPEDVTLGLLGAEVADHLDVAAVVADRPVDAGGAAVGVDLAGQVGAQLLRHRGDVVVALLGPAEDRRQEAAAALGAVELGHGAGAVQGDAGLGPLPVRLHQDRRRHPQPAAAGRVDVDLTEGLLDLFQLRHGGWSPLCAAGPGTT